MEGIPGFIYAQKKLGYLSNDLLYQFENATSASASAGPNDSLEPAWRYPDGSGADFFRKCSDMVRADLAVVSVEVAAEKYVSSKQTLKVDFPGKLAALGESDCAS